MDIYPQDLGRALEGEARRRREYFHRAPLTGAGGSPNERQIALRPVFLGAWAFMFAAAGLFAFHIGGIFLPLVAGAVAALLVTFALKRVRKTRKKHSVPTGQQALTAQEIEWLRADDSDSLHGAYLDLTLTALASPAPPDGLSHTHLRDALRTLGDAVRDVPELSFKLTPRDAKEMQTVAERLTHDAAQEADSVVADSLRRRADALHSQAETFTRAQSLLRRNAALRLELFDQMAALRTGLAASAIGHTGGARDLSALAASIASVAAEAAAVTGARAEVDSFLHAPDETLAAQKRAQ